MRSRITNTLTFPRIRGCYSCSGILFSYPRRRPSLPCPCIPPRDLVLMKQSSARYGNLVSFLFNIFNSFISSFKSTTAI